ncbi:MAG: DUF1573 domain-containing protein [Candidatus Zixiibacteriota bacterium]|nr:MAG: DUF1573 domain-containing protein [candidate division Zixibacteria bacterium]
MKFRIFYITIIMALTGQVPAQTRLVLHNPEIDFGRVPAASIVGSTIACSGPGSDTLSITGIKTGCGCIAAYPESTVISPGDTVEIRFFWDTRTDSGILSQTAYIFTDAGPDPHRVSFTANVAPVTDSAGMISCYPSQTVTLPEPPGTGSTRGTVRVKNVSGEVITVRLVSGASESLAIEYPETLEAEASGQFNFRLAAGSWRSAYASSATFELESGGGLVQRITFPVSGGNSRLGTVLTTERE